MDQSMCNCWQKFEIRFPFNRLVFNLIELNWMSFLMIVLLVIFPGFPFLDWYKNWCLKSKRSKRYKSLIFSNLNLIRLFHRSRFKVLISIISIQIWKRPQFDSNLLNFVFVVFVYYSSKKINWKRMGRYLFGQCLINVINKYNLTTAPKLAPNSFAIERNSKCERISLAISYHWKFHCWCNQSKRMAKAENTKKRFFLYLFFFVFFLFQIMPQLMTEIIE